VRTFAIDPLQPTTFYKGDSFLGLYRSTDAGETWALIGPGPVATNAGWTALTASSRTEGTLWIASGIGSGPITLYRSADGGVTWRAETGGLPPTLTLEEEPGTGALLLGSTKGLYRKRPADAAFARVEGLWNPALRATEVSRFAFLPGIVLAATSSGLALSSDGGAHWDLREHGLLGIGVSLAPARDGTLYAAASSPSHEAGGCAKSEPLKPSFFSISSASLSTSSSCSTARSTHSMHELFSSAAGRSIHGPGSTLWAPGLNL